VMLRRARDGTCAAYIVDGTRRETFLQADPKVTDLLSHERFVRHERAAQP